MIPADAYPNRPADLAAMSNTEVLSAFALAVHYEAQGHQDAMSSKVNDYRREILYRMGGLSEDD